MTDPGTVKMSVRFCFCLLLLFGPGLVPYAQKSADDEAKRHFDRGVVLGASDDPRAEQEYKAAIKCRGGFYPEAWEELAQLYRGQLRLSEAAVALERYIAQTPQDDHGDDYKDLAALKRMMVLEKRVNNSDIPPLNNLLEFIRFVTAYSKRERAIPYAEKAQELYPNSSAAHLVLARLLPDDQKERQFALITKAVELDPADPSPHTALGSYYFWRGQGKIPEAIKEFRRALEVSGGQYAPAWEGLGRSLAASGEKKEAIVAFQTYLRVRETPSQNDAVIKREIERLSKGY